MSLLILVLLQITVMSWRVRAEAEPISAVVSGFLNGTRFRDDSSVAPLLLRDLLNSSEHVVLVSDYSDDSSAVSAVMPLTCSLTVLTCDAGVLYLVLTRLMLTRPRHTVLMHCHDPISILQLMKEPSMRNRRLQWLVLGEVELRKAFLSFVSVKQQVLLLTPIKEGYDVEEPIMNSNGDTRLEMVSRWFSEKQNQQQFLSSDLVYADFRGRQLIVVANDGGIFAELEEVQNGFYKGYGIDISIIDILASKFNFTYKIIQPPDGDWGNLQDDGTVTGMIGVVARDEGDIAVDSITISESRENVVDFSVSYYQESTRLVSGSLEMKSAALTILRPFSVKIWAYLVISMVLIGPITVIINHVGAKFIDDKNGTQIRLERTNSEPLSLGDSSTENKIIPPRTGIAELDKQAKEGVQSSDLQQLWTQIRWTYLNMFRTLVIQGNRLPVHNLSISILFIFWYFFGLVIDTAYSGSLTAVFAAPAFERPINTLEDAIKACEEDGYTLVLTKDTSIDQLIRESEAGVYRKLYELIDEEKSYVNDKFETILHGKYVSFDTPIFHLSKSIELNKKFHIGSERFYTQSYGFALQTGSPYLASFDDTLLRLVDAGIVNHIVQQQLLFEHGSRRVLEMQASTKKTFTSSNLSIQHLQGAFFLLSMGIVLGAIALCAEKQITSIKTY